MEHCDCLQYFCAGIWHEAWTGCHSCSEVPCYPQDGSQSFSAWSWLLAGLPFVWMAKKTYTGFISKSDQTQWGLRHLVIRLTEGNSGPETHTPFLSKLSISSGFSQKGLGARWMFGTWMSHLSPGWENLLPITCQVSESPAGHDVFLWFQVAKIQLNFNLHLPWDTSS